MLDITVIGAGPAGSIAAILLVRAGCHVTLLEQHTFPRDKVCGECLSPLALDVLTRAGLSSLVQGLNPAHFTRALFHLSDGPTLEVPLPRAVWGVSRSALDAALLQAARDAGAFIRQPVRCERVVPGRRPTLLVRCLISNKIDELTCDWLLIADGKGALLPITPAPTSDFGIKAHFTNITGPRDAIELFGINGHYGGLAAVENNRWNAAFSVPVTRLRAHAGNLTTLFDEMSHENPTLAVRLRNAVRLGPWLAAPLPRSAVTSMWPPHVIPIGNAAAALEPVGGEGIGLAMRSAESAAQALICLRCGGDESALVALPWCFDRLWWARSLIARGIARIFSTPSLATAVAPVLETNTVLSRTIMRLSQIP